MQTSLMLLKDKVRKMNKEKKIKMLIPSIGLALIISGCQSSFLTNMDDKGTLQL